MAWKICEGSLWGNDPMTHIFVCCHDGGSINKLPPGPSKAHLQQFGQSVNPNAEFVCRHGQRHKLERVNAMAFQPYHWEEDKKS